MYWHFAKKGSGTWNVINKIPYPALVISICWKFLRWRWRYFHFGKAWETVNFEPLHHIALQSFGSQFQSTKKKVREKKHGRKGKQIMQRFVLMISKNGRQPDPGHPKTFLAILTTVQKRWNQFPTLKIVPWKQWFVSTLQRIAHTLYSIGDIVLFRATRR